jgi:hypothetical protein
MLFGRQVSLQIGREGGGTAKTFEGFRVTFDVTMSKSSTPNSAVIEAFNLNPASIALAQDPKAVVRLFVGYDVPRQIFQGHPIANGVRLDRRGPDRVLRLELQDGGRAWRDARVAVSYTTSTTLRQVYDAIAAQLDLPAGTVEIDEDFTFPKGISLAGPARDVLDRLAASTSSDWFIRDGAIQFIGTGGDTGEQAVVFSATAGNLIGSPVPKDNGIEITALLAPSLRPGKVFAVESEDYNGLYVAGDVGFKGDSGWDRPFYVTTSGTPRSTPKT